MFVDIEDNDDIEKNEALFNMFKTVGIFPEYMYMWATVGDVLKIHSHQSTFQKASRIIPANMRTLPKEKLAHQKRK